MNLGSGKLHATSAGLLMSGGSAFLCAIRLRRNKFKEASIRHEKGMQPGNHRRRISPDRAFPYYSDSPVVFLEPLYGLGVPLSVPNQLVLPKLAVLIGKLEEPASVVSVPEASVNEYDCPVLSDDNVWTSWQSAVMQAVTNAACEETLSNHQFRQRVFAADAAHHGGSHRGFDDVCHEVFR